MKDLWPNLDKIAPLLKNCCPKILFLDFDGTLAPIADRPQDAKLPGETKQILKRLSEKENFYLGVISGRELSDIKTKIGIPNIIYGGNHGLEWEIFDKTDSYPIPEKALLIIKEILKQLNKIVCQFNGLLIEDKKFVLSFHYRLADKATLPAIKSQFKKVLKPYVKNGAVSVISGKMVFEICPNVNWDKGHFAKFVINEIRTETKKTPVAVAIGDDATDETIFKSFRQGITIRVGKNTKSKAFYSLKGIKGVIKFLSWINNS